MVLGKHAREAQDFITLPQALGRLDGLLRRGKPTIGALRQSSHGLSGKQRSLGDVATPKMSLGTEQLEFSAIFRARIANFRAGRVSDHGGKIIRIEGLFGSAAIETSRTR